MRCSCAQGLPPMRGSTRSHHNGMSHVSLILACAEIARFFNGPESFTPDATVLTPRVVIHTTDAQTSAFAVCLVWYAVSPGGVRVAILWALEFPLARNPTLTATTKERDTPEHVVGFRNLP